ncbi:hypothetical protein R1sor_024052 [Riccia sorocarpa]|uniref:Uncharacterized protein n=1 Tax=Riccia sorocarpa TaxID=122646 RepID=A0ABD3GQX9_9MARC
MLNAEFPGAKDFASSIKLERPRQNGVMAKQQVRGRKEPSPGKKVSEVEAAYVVQSYLIEKQFATTLAGFRVDAAPILNSLKNAPPAVRSITMILNDYVILREMQQSLQDEIARLEQNLKEAHRALQLERSRMNSFMQGIHENIALYQSSTVPPTALTLPSVSNSPSSSAIVFQVGHNAVPCASMDTSKTPSSVRGTIPGSATNKRKNGLGKTPQEPSGSEVPAAKVIASKKPRPSGQVSGPTSGGPPLMPWMCGMVRKNSMNMVRPVLPFHEAHVPPSSGTAVKTSKQAGRPAAPSLSSPKFTSHPAPASSKQPTFTSPATPTADIDKQNIGSSVPHDGSAKLPTEACFSLDDKPCSQDPRTPPQNNSPVILCGNSSIIVSEKLSETTPPKQPHGIVSLPPESNSNPSPSFKNSCTPPIALGCHTSHQFPENRITEETSLYLQSRSGSSPQSYHSDKTKVEFHFTKPPSKTSRPLHFSDSGVPSQAESENSVPAVSCAVKVRYSKVPSQVESAANEVSHPAGDLSGSAIGTQVESPASQVPPPSTYYRPSECDGAVASAIPTGDNPEHNTDDLFLIDDILASLDDPAFSSLGDMLVANEISMNGLDASAQNLGEVDFTNSQGMTNRSSVGEDSFDFLCPPEAEHGNGIQVPVVQDSAWSDSSTKCGILSDPTEDPSCSSLPGVPVLSERDPNRSTREGTGKRCTSSSKANSRRESRSKTPPGQENIPSHDSFRMEELL